MALRPSEAMYETSDSVNQLDQCCCSASWAPLIWSKECWSDAPLKAPENRLVLSIQRSSTSQLPMFTPRKNDVEVVEIASFEELKGGLVLLGSAGTDVFCAAIDAPVPLA